MDLSLLRDAALAGALLGCFYAAVAIGLTLSFGLLDVPVVAHPAFVIAGGYGVVLLGHAGVPPLVAGLLLVPVFFGFGWLLYSFYDRAFERRGEDASTRGIAFFFGIAFIVEVTLAMTFGVDAQMVETGLRGKSLEVAGLRLPLRMLVAAGVSLLMAAALGLYLKRSFAGQAMAGVAQDPMALQLVGGNPAAVRRLAFAIGTATVAIAGGLMVMIGPIEPALGRQYIGKVFAICVLAGLGSIRGTIVAAILLGVAENIVLGTWGSSWAPAVAFAILLLVLAVKPTGLYGR